MNWWRGGDEWDQVWTGLDGLARSGPEGQDACAQATRSLFVRFFFLLQGSRPRFFLSFSLSLSSLRAAPCCRGERELTLFPFAWFMHGLGSCFMRTQEISTKETERTSAEVWGRRMDVVSSLVCFVVLFFIFYFHFHHASTLLFRKVVSLFDNCSWGTKGKHGPFRVCFFCLLFYFIFLLVRIIIVIFLWCVCVVSVGGEEGRKSVGHGFLG